MDYLKIDGTFVKDVLENPIDCIIIEAINQVAHAIGIQSIAEFVEAALSAINLVYRRDLEVS